MQCLTVVQKSDEEFSYVENGGIDIPRDIKDGKRFCLLLN